MIFDMEVKSAGPVPFMNEHSWVVDKNVPGVYNTQPFNYQNFMRYIKRTPEAIGIIRAMITDVLSDGVVWKTFNNTKGGKTKIAKAKAWARNSQVWTKKLPEGLTDWFIYGNNLIWTGMSNDQVKEIALSAVSKLEFKGINQVEVMNKVVSEIVESSLDYRNIPWSTVTIDSSSTDITGYSQNMGQNISTGVVRGGGSSGGVPGDNNGFNRRWDVDEVIHATLMNLDGKAYGFSPMIASTSVISTLALIKDYNGYKFDNGGEPDLIFSFPQEIADNPNVKSFTRYLTEKRKSKNKHGHMVLTGEVNIEHVSDHNKDMEYRMLAIYYTGILAFAFNMPVGRVQSILGSAVKTGNQDLSDSAYWRSISHMQKYWEDLLNTNIFEPQFGVTFSFKRSYKQDEVREAQSKMLNIQWMTNMMSMGLKPSQNYVKSVLAIDDEDVDWNFFNKMNPLDVVPKGDGNQPKNSDMKNGDGKRASDEKKREVMTNKTNVP